MLSSTAAEKSSPRQTQKPHTRVLHLSWGGIDCAYKRANRADAEVGAAFSAVVFDFAVTGRHSSADVPVLRFQAVRPEARSSLPLSTHVPHSKGVFLRTDYFQNRRARRAPSPRRPHDVL